MKKTLKTPSTYYRHYKNKPYKFLGVVRHSETLEKMVLYEARYKNEKGAFWVRPEKMFFESVAMHGKKRPRFQNVPIELQYKVFQKWSDLAVILPLLKKIFSTTEMNSLKLELAARKPVYGWLAFFDGELAGFKMGYALSADTFMSWLGGVDEKFRRLGVGEFLMSAQHETLEAETKFKRIRTLTKNQWREMIILNLKSRFDIIGSYTDSSGEPKLILEKKI